MAMFRQCILVVLFALPAMLLQAQPPDRPSLAEIEIRKVFIDANREKLLGNYQDAAYLYREVLNKNPNSHAAAYELARMYDVLEEDKRALQAIEKAVRLAPDNVWYRDFYAQVLERNGEFGKAAGVYEKLSEENPENEYFMFQQAFYLIKDNKPAEAIVMYDKLERKIGVKEELTRKKYTLYYGLGDNKRAADEIQKLINTFPAETAYRHILAEFYLQTDQRKQAAQVYQEILKVDPKDPEANLALAGSFKGSGQHSKYLDAIRPVIKKGDVDIDLKIKELFPYITKIADSDDEVFKTDLLNIGKTLTEVHPLEAKAFSMYGDMLFQAGKSKEALEAYNKTLDLDKNVFAVWEQIMYIHLERSDWKALADLSEESMDYFPNQARVYYMNGIAQSNLGKSSDAADMWEQALMMSGKNTMLKYDITNRLGVEYYKLKKYDKSDRMFEKALNLVPDSYAALHNYSYHLGQRGARLEEAKEMAIRANELLPDQSALQDNLGYIHFLLENYKEAKSWLEKAIGNGGDKSPIVLEHYGDTLFKLGKKDLALVEWQKAKAAGGQSEILDRKISDKKL